VSRLPGTRRGRGARVTLRAKIFDIGAGVSKALLHWRKIGQTEVKNASKINRRFCAFSLKVA
jgi:hypothetical protein